MRQLTDKQVLEEEQIERQKEEIDRAVENESEIRTDIESTYEAIIKAVTEKRDLLLKDLRTSSQQQLDELKSDVETREMAIHKYKQERELLEQALNSQSEMDVYKVYQTYRTETGDRDERETSTAKHEDITWKRNTALLKTVEEMDLGEIKREGEFDPTTTPVPDPTTTPF